MQFSAAAEPDTALQHAELPRAKLLDVSTLSAYLLGFWCGE